MSSIAALVLVSRNASADVDGDRFRLVWVRGTGAESCETEGTVAERVTARLGRNPFATDAPRVIEAFVTRDASAWSARIEVRDLAGKRVGEREITSSAEGCAPVVSAMTLAIALAIDPEAALRAEPVIPVPPPAPPPPAHAPILPSPSPPCPLSTPCPRPSTTAIAPRGTVIVAARAGAGSGFVPGFAPGFEGAIEIKPQSRFSASAGALWFPDSHTAARDFAFGLTAAFAGGCVDALAASRGSLAACASFYAGEITSVTFNLDPTNPGGRVWLAVSTGVKLSVVVAGPLRLQMGIDAVAPLLRYRFAIQGTTTLAYQENVIPLFGFLGVGVSFP